MDFVGLKVAGAAAVVAGIVYLYRKYKADQARPGGLDDLLAEADTLLQSFEAVVSAKATEVEKYISDALNLDELKANAQAELDRAKVKAEKIKAAILD